MSCDLIVNHEGGHVGWICGGGKWTALEDIETKWCFGCRYYTDHQLHRLDRDWYDPVWAWKCPDCRRDCTRFPGSDW